MLQLSSKMKLKLQLRSAIRQTPSTRRVASSRHFCAKASGVDGSQPSSVTSSAPTSSSSAAFPMASESASQAAVQYPTDSPLTHPHAIPAHSHQQPMAHSQSHSQGQSLSQPHSHEAQCTREVPVVKTNKNLTVWEKGKAFANVAWTGAGKFYSNLSEVKALKKRPVESLNYLERMMLYHNSQDWGRLVPILFWWKVLPLSFLYLPLFFLMYPTVLPSTFDVARLAQVDYKATLFDRNLREKRRKYYCALEGNIPVRSAVIEQIDAQGVLSSQFVLKQADAMRNEPGLRLDELSRTHLQALMLALSLRPLTLAVWPTSLMRRNLARHFRHLAHCDKALSVESISSLQQEDLMEACLQRGLVIANLSVEEMKEQLVAWITIGASVPTPSEQSSNDLPSQNKPQPLSSTTLVSALTKSAVTALPDSVRAVLPPFISNPLKSTRVPNLAHLLVVCVHAFQFRHLRLVHHEHSRAKWVIE